MNNLAWELRAQDPQAAIAHATRATELQPENTAALDTLAVIQWELGMLNEAGTTFESIRKLDPTDPSILFHGARIQAALGKKEDAKSILEPLINNNVQFPDSDAARALYNEL